MTRDSKQYQKEYYKNNKLSKKTQQIIEETERIMECKRESVSAIEYREKLIWAFIRGEKDLR